MNIVVTNDLKWHPKPTLWLSECGVGLHHATLPVSSVLILQNKHVHPTQTKSTQVNLAQTPKSFGRLTRIRICGPQTTVQQMTDRVPITYTTGTFIQSFVHKQQRPGASFQQPVMAYFGEAEET